MNVQVITRKFDCSPGTQEEIKAKIMKLGDHYPSPVSGKVIMEKMDYRFRVEIVLQGKVDAKAIYTDNDLEIAFDKSYEKVEKQLKKFKEKIQRHKSRGEKFSQYRELVVAPEGVENLDFQPEIIIEKPYIIKPMSVDEAIMQMELLHKEFYVFLNQDDEELNIVRKRKDGNYGLIKK